MASYNLPESVSEGQTGHLTHTGKIHDIVNKFHYDQVESPGVVPVWDGTAYGPAHPIVTTFYDGVQNLVVPADWNGTLQRFRGGPNTITIQTEAVLNLPIGFAFSVLMWSGSATETVTVVGPSDGTLRSYPDIHGNRTLAGRYAFATVTKITTPNIWLITGQLL